MADLFPSHASAVMSLWKIKATSASMDDKTATDSVKRLNQQLVEAAAAGDIDSCKLALSGGAKNRLAMLMEFMRTKNAQCAWFAFELLEKEVDSPEEDHSGEMEMLFRLVGLVGDKGMCHRAIALFDRIVKNACLHMYQRFTCEKVRSELEETFLLPMIECAAESGLLEICETVRLEKGNRAEYMIKGGSRGNSVAICQRAIDLGARVYACNVEDAALYGSFDVFSLLLKQWFSTARHEPCDGRENIEWGIFSGRDSAKKLHYLLTVLRSVGEKLKWEIPSPDDILRRAAESQNVELCRYARERGPTDLTLVYSMKSKPITREVLELGIEWGVDINKLDCRPFIEHMDEWHCGDPNFRVFIRERRKKNVIAVAQLYNLLHEHGYSRYKDMLEQSISMMCSSSLIEMVVKWGKNHLKEGDADYEEFNKLCRSLPKELADRYPDDPYADQPL
jgi:hypothetical protein